MSGLGILGEHAVRQLKIILIFPIDVIPLHDLKQTMLIGHNALLGWIKNLSVNVYLLLLICLMHMSIFPTWY